MNTSARKVYLVSCLALLLLVCLSACGTNTPSSATTASSKFSAIPLGKGMDPEPGTDGKPAPLPNGHSESILIAQGIAYVGSDNGSLLWRQNVVGSGEGSDAAGPQTVGDDVVLIGGDNGVVQVIRVSDGKLLWHYAIKELAVQSPPVLSVNIFFASSQSYQQALEIVTSLGLKTFADCQWASWAPSDNMVFFGNDHEMAVLATVNSAPLWLTRLAATRGIQMVQPGGPHSCPLMRPGNGPGYLPTSQANAYVQVTFAHTTQYAALNAVNGLGFRLAAPCYEQGRARGDKPAWSSMDQPSTFNQSNTLILATTSINAITWQSQLGAVKGVVKVDVPFKAVC